MLASIASAVHTVVATERKPYIEWKMLSASCDQDLVCNTGLRHTIQAVDGVLQTVVWP